MTKSNIEKYGADGIIGNCPRCKSSDIRVIKHRQDSQTVSEIVCNACHHSIRGVNAQYVQHRWNTQKETLVDYVLPIMHKNPYTAYISEYTANTWGGVSKLCTYISKQLGVPVVSRSPVRYEGAGYILEALYEGGRE
jgi:hypothetical protein